MKLTLQTVDTTYIAQTWPLVVNYIYDSLHEGLEERFLDYRIDHVQSYLTSGQWLLVVAVDEQGEIRGASTLSFVNYPLNRVAFMTTTGGKMIANPAILEQLKVICRQRGATKIQAFCRDSMVRLLERCDFEPCSTLVEVKI
jgi:hypothetical protein